MDAETASNPALGPQKPGQAHSEAGDRKSERDQQASAAELVRGKRKHDAGQGGGAPPQATEGEAEAGREAEADEARGGSGTTAAGDVAASEEGHDLPNAVIEEGRLYMLYRPKVQVDEVTGMDDVQLFYMVLDPLSPPGHKARLVVVPKKRLPSQAGEKRGRERFYGFVQATALRGSDAAAPEAAASGGGAAGGGEGAGPSEEGGDEGGEDGGGGGLSGVKALVAGLGEEEYEIKTRGTRHQGAARVLAEAAYVIGKGGKRNATHLAYKLEVPKDPGLAQRMFHVEREGELVVSIKNPENRPPGAPTAGPAPAAYNEQQAKRLKGHAWVGVEDSSMLDVEGAELLLIGANAGDPVGHLGEAGEELLEVYYSDAEDAADTDKVRAELEPANTHDVLPGGPAATGELE